MTLLKSYILFISLLCFYTKSITGQCPTINFANQDQIDAFPQDYPNCVHFDGIIVISDLNNSNIINVDSLIQLESCDGIIIQAPDLLSIKGFSNIIGTLESGIRIDSAQELVSLEGLEGITSLKSRFNLRNIPKVTDLLPLRNIIDVNDIVGAAALYNTGIISLAGIGQFIPNDNTIRLSIHENPNLETCNVKFACDFLENLISCNGNFHLIENNAPGCNSKEEILASCETLSTDPENPPFTDLKIYPNPVKDRLFVEAAEPMSFAILNNVGQDVLYKEDKQLSHILDTQELLPGIYYVKIYNDQRFIFKRIVVE